MKMAESLHQIAKIVGKRHIRNDLLTVFQDFARDTIEVQQSLIKNLYNFFKAIPESERSDVAKELNMFNTLDVGSQWRLRYQFIE